MKINLGYLLLSILGSLTAFGQTIDADTLKSFTKEANTQYAVHKIEPLITRPITGQNLGEALQLMSSVFIKSNGMGGLASISLRGGSASQTQVFWEGMAINSPTLGQSDLSLLPMEFIAYVNINHAGASSQHGLGGIAGSLFLGSPGYSSYGSHLFFKKEIGSFGLDNTVAKLSFGIDSRVYSETVLIKKTAVNNFKFQDYSKPFASTVQRKNANISQLGFQERVHLKTKKGRLKIIFNYLDTERRIPVAIGVQDQTQTQQDKNFKSSIQYKISKSVQGDGEEYRSFSHKASLGFVHDNLNYQNQSASINSDYMTSNLAGQFHSNFEFKKKVTLRTQLNEYLFRANSAGFDAVQFQNRFSTYASISKEWNSTFLSFNIQEVLIDSDLTPVITNVGAYQTFNVGDNEIKFFGNAGTNYRHPTLNDLYWSVGGNENLLPERSINYEFGFKTRDNYSNKPLEIGMTYFQDFVTNWIQWLPNETGVWSPENVKSVNKKGVESFLLFRKRINTTKYALFTINHTWVDASITASSVNTNDVGKKLIYTPEHIVNLDATIQLNQWSIRYYQTITSRFFLDRDNNTYLPYSAPGNLKIGFTFKEDVNVNKTFLNAEITIHNIWGEAYQIIANQPMPGRWVSFSLTYLLHNNEFGKPKY